jgi:hypothetical protein
VLDRSGTAEHPVDPERQDEIADAEAANRSKAQILRAQATTEWSAAKQRFGDDLVE